MAWLLGDSTNLEDCMRARLLASVLLDNSGSPLQKALETTDLGTAPSPMCGLEDSHKELCFACGIEGSNSHQADAVEAMIMEVLEAVAENGIPEEQVAASLHQLELSQREVSGDSYPYGLNLILTCLTSATHRGDPVSLLNLDPILERMQQQITDPNYIKSLAKDLLLNNQHRIRLVLKPDPALAKNREQAEQNRLSDIKNSLSEEQKKAIINAASALRERQEMAEDMEVLPKVGLADVPATISYPEAFKRQQKPLPLTSYSAGTNGLAYQQITMPLPNLTAEQMDLLPLYSTCVTEMGVGSRDYQQTQLWHSSIVGSYTATASVRSDKDNLSQLHGKFTLASKGLASNQQAMSELMQESFAQVRFDELLRLKELLAQILTHRESSVVSNGHVLAMIAASSGLSSYGHLNQRWGGMSGLIQLRKLTADMESEANLEQLSQQLQAIHKLFLNQPRRYLLVSEKDRLSEFGAVIDNTFANENNRMQDNNLIDYSPTLQPVNHSWITNTQVSFCARAFPTVASSHPDAAALTVLGGILRNGYLHRAIREQGGAYGAGAAQDNQSGAFRFFSYRDPRITETLDDFDRSIDWVLENPLGKDKIEQAILGVISTLDKPGSPAGEAIQAFHGELCGRSKESQSEFRNRVLAVDEIKLKQVSDQYLRQQKAHTAVITNADLAAKLPLQPSAA
jgi:Zn-dependent M16 (insulinase) family peptidase